MRDRPSCSEVRANWEPNLRTSLGFLAGRDKGVFNKVAEKKVTLARMHSDAHVSALTRSVDLYALCCLNFTTFSFGCGAFMLFLRVLFFLNACNTGSNTTPETS